MRSVAKPVPEAIARALERATRDISQVRARELAREMREKAERQERARKEAFRRRLAMGEIVSRVGLDDWSVEEVLGLLLDGKERVGSSATMRLGMRQRGEQHLQNAPQRRLGSRGQRAKPSAPIVSTAADNSARSTPHENSLQAPPNVPTSVSSTRKLPSASTAR